MSRGELSGPERWLKSISVGARPQCRRMLQVLEGQATRGSPHMLRINGAQKAALLARIRTLCRPPGSPFVCSLKMQMPAGRPAGGWRVGAARRAGWRGAWPAGTARATHEEQAAKAMQAAFQHQAAFQSLAACSSAHPGAARCEVHSLQEGLRQGSRPGVSGLATPLPRTIQR